MTENDPTGLVSGEDEDAEKPSNSNITSSRSSQVAEMDDLNERFSQQQVMISQLKEMVIAEEAARTQKIASSRQKMEKCVSQLARIRDRAKVTKLKNAPDRPSVLSTPSPIQSQHATPAPSEERGDNILPSLEVNTLLPQDVSSDVIVSTPITELNIPISTASPTVLSVPWKSAEIGTKSKTPSREVTKMLYQQIKEHKAMIAERSKNEKDLELALAKIQKQLQESQHQSAELLQLGQSKIKVTLPVLTPEESIESNKIINELQNKIKLLEGNILDLQETCKEKDSVIDAKTMAITLMSADLSKKGKNTLDLLDDTKEQMQKMQENFASMESKMKIEKQEIIDELEVCRNRVIYLEEANTILETERFNLSVHNNNLEEQLVMKECEINRMKVELMENLKNIEKLNMKVDKSVETDLGSEEEKGTNEISQMNALSDKIEILENLNAVLRQSNIELQEKINPSVSPEKEQSLSRQMKEDLSKSTKKGKTAPKPKGSQKFKNIPAAKTDVTLKSTDGKDLNKDLQETVQRLEIVIKSLNKQVIEKEILLAKKETEYEDLKTSIIAIPNPKFQETRECSEIGKPQIDNLSTSLGPDLIDSASTSFEESLGNTTLQDLEKSESINTEDPDAMKQQLEAALKKINKFSKELAEANKNMLKVKVSHKTKVKQMQKSIDDFSKVSDSHSEMVRLQGEVSQLTHKIAELEEDKGNLQLHLVDYDSGRVSDSQLHAKLLEMENIAEERLKAIADLETQKFDLVQELHSVKQQITALEDKVSDLTYFENEHVSAELKLAELEEQLDILHAKHKETLTKVECLEAEKVQLLSSVDILRNEKLDINNKLDIYIQENIDLIDKLDKLSAEKVSSAESIEMVESLTTQEKMEIEEYEKGLDLANPDNNDSNLPKESIRKESFSKSLSESSELQAKIDLFTQERHEVMEKLDILKNENITLTSKLEQLLQEKNMLEEKCESLRVQTGNISEVLRSEEEKNKLISVDIDSLKQENRALLEQIKKLFTGEHVRMDEAVIPETLEVLPTSEKEFVELSSKNLESKPEIGVKETLQSSESPDQAFKMSSKDTKKYTKEILRLKNVVKHQEIEIHNLTSQLSEIKDLPSQIDLLLKDKNDRENDLQMALQDNKTLTEQLSNFKGEKELFNQQLAELQKHLNELYLEKQTLLRVIEDKESVMRLVDDNVKVKVDQINELHIRNDQQKKEIDALTEVVSDKDKEIAECVNQINQLDSVSKKLKSTITQFEEEKSASSSHVNVIKNLENSIVQLQNVVLENENKIKHLQSELGQSTEASELLKLQLLEHQSKINEMKETLNENQKEMSIVMKEKNERQNEILRLQGECSSKDEEIHEIKLQLRKESRQYDKMKNNLQEIENVKDALQARVLELEETCEVYKTNVLKQQEEYSLLDKKCKEQFEKLKKFAANFKKKASLCTDLETQLANLKTEFQNQVNKYEVSCLSINTLQQELHVLNSQYNNVQSEIQQASSSQKTLNSLEQQLSEYQNQISNIQSQYEKALSQIDFQALQNQELLSMKDSLLIQLSEKESRANQLTLENISLENKVNVHEIELENSKTALSKIDIMEKQIYEKQQEINNLIEKLDVVQSNYDKFKRGHEAKIQERDLYIENLQGEILKHKDRISRLEDSVSTMEERRSSLERKADRLVTKLHEKDAACSESSIHEDHLEKRLAALIAHDELIQKQLHDTQNENQEFLDKINCLSESNKNFKSELENTRLDINHLKNEIAHLQDMDDERIQAGERIAHLENELKRVSVEYSEILKKKTKDYEYLESDLHSQISNSEAQRRLSKEQYDRLQDEMLLQTQILKDIHSDYDLLKIEHENTLQKLNVEISKNVTTQQDNLVNIEKFTQQADMEKKVNELSLVLIEKDEEIEKLLVQSQEASSNAVVDVPPETQLKNYFGECMKDQDSIIYEKNVEIEKLDRQFKSCLSQLSDAVDAEKYLKECCSSLTNSISNKDAIINQLQNELTQLKTFIQSVSAQVPISTEIIELHLEPKCIQQLSGANIDVKDKFMEQPLDSKALKYLNDQIIPTDEMNIESSSDFEKHMIRSFQHDAPEQVQTEVEISSSNNATPVVEEILQPKSAYLCHKDEPIELSVEEEDGWGWSGQVSENQNMETLISQNTNVWDPNKVLELELRIQRLTEEKNNITLELTQSQQKVSKALIKLKEFKHKNDVLNKEIKSLKASSDFNMLDMAIQDELGSQVKKLEDKIKEIMLDINKEKLEKDGLLKRIDVLTSANERLMEMKERQDVEMGVFKTKNRELNERIKNLEWDTNLTDEAESNIPVNISVPKTETSEINNDVFLSKQINDLNKKIQDLESDNDELQAFIEEQQVQINKSKSLEVDFERLKNQESLKYAEFEKENESLKIQLNKVNERCAVANSEIEHIKTRESLELSEMKKENNDITEKILKMKEHCDKVNFEVEKYKVESCQLLEIQKENENLKEKLDQVNTTYVSELEKVSVEKFKLKSELESLLGYNKQTDYLVVENTDLKEKLQALIKEYYEFQEKFNEIATDKDRIEMELNCLLKEKKELEFINKDITSQEAACKAELIKISYENEELSEKYDNLLKKLNDKNVCDETKQIIKFTDQLHNLSQELDAKNVELVALNQKIDAYETDKISLQNNIDKLNDENTTLLSNLAELRNNVTDAIDQRGAEVAEMWKQHLAMREVEFNNVEQTLRDAILSLETQHSHSNDLYSECNKMLDDAKRQLDEVTNERNTFKQLYENELPLELHKYESLLKEKENKECNIVKVKEDEISLLNQEIMQHRSMYEKLAEYERLISAKDKELEESILQNKHLEENYKRRIYEYEIISSNKDSDFDNIRQQLCQAENKLSDMVHENEAELANMRLKLHEERTSYENSIAELRNNVETLEVELETKINECKTMNYKIQELQTVIDEDNAQLLELRKALENQEIEIVTLKENLISQADAYEQLHISHMKSKSERHVTFSEDTKPGAEITEMRTVTSHDSSSDKPQRADLDLALYMLHQRDVRCEELTVELMQLLEERDTLQLKLSNALRATEDMRSKRSPSQSKSLDSHTVSDDKTPRTVQEESGLGESAGPSGPQSLSESQADAVDRRTEESDDKSLETKLSELHLVGHRKDIRLKDDSEHRNRQMELLQRDVQHLPPEAAARLREAHFTLTRDSQSASTVLLNWLWGKTTPKVVHM